MTRSPARAGFTLLELSVVIAILGILVGGVLATQGYLRTTQLTTAMNEAKLMLSVFDQFRQKYNAIPGDMSTASAMWTGAPNGDGNGYIFRGGFNGAGANNTNEHYYVFWHLNRAGFLTGSYTGVAGSGGADHAVPGTNVAASSIPGSGFYFTNFNTATGYLDDADSFYFGGFYGSYLTLGAATSNSMPTGPLLSAPQAYELDMKFDNGKPGTGWIRAPKFALAAECTTTNDKLTADYQSFDRGPKCIFLMTPR